jgi:hypothetical protein
MEGEDFPPENQEFLRKVQQRINSRQKVIDATKFRQILENLLECKVKNGKFFQGFKLEVVLEFSEAGFQFESPSDETHPFYDLWKKYSKEPREEQQELQKAAEVCILL